MDEENIAERRQTLWRLCETMIEEVPGALFPTLTLELLRDLSAAEKRIELAGGYHGRTAREIEIAEWIESEPFVVGDETRRAIVDLLDLVDAGRNRVEPLEEKVEALEDRERNLENQCRELEGVTENAHAYSKKLKKTHDAVLTRIREVLPAKDLEDGIGQIIMKMEGWMHQLTLIDSKVQESMQTKEAMRMRLYVLEEAIKHHRKQKADDRCIEDDDRLYEILGDGIRCDRRVGSKFEMLRNCARFIENRCQGGRWVSYADMETVLLRIYQTARSSTPFDAMANLEKIEGIVNAIIIPEPSPLEDLCRVRSATTTTQSGEQPPTETSSGTS